jgi:hypothetical protein
MAIAVMTVTTALHMQLPLVWQPAAAQAAQQAAAMAAPGSMGNIPADEAQELQEMLSEEVALPSQLLDFLKLFDKVRGGSSSNSGGSSSSSSSSSDRDRQHQQQYRKLSLHRISALLACCRSLTPVLPPNIHTQGTPSNSKQLEAARQKVGFSRSMEGRVTLIANDGEKFQIKPDSSTAGVLLLRCVFVCEGVGGLEAGRAREEQQLLLGVAVHTHLQGTQAAAVVLPCAPLTPLLSVCSTCTRAPHCSAHQPPVCVPWPPAAPRDALGYCYYLPPDPVGSLQQLDLSDDLMVAQLFANHLWEDLLEPLEVEAPSMFKAPGGEGVPVKQLQLTEQEWRLVASLVDEAELQPEEPLEPLPGEQ